MSTVLLAVSALCATALAQSICAAKPNSSTIECIFTDPHRYYHWTIPESYENMQIEIFGASGGASYRYDELDQATRGLGAYVKLNVRNGIKAGLGMTIRPAANGADATKNSSGSGGHLSGSGGESDVRYCTGMNRYAGAGGSAAAIYLPHERARIIIGGGGGAGGFYRRDNALGGNALPVKNLPAESIFEMEDETNYFETLGSPGQGAAFNEEGGSGGQYPPSAALGMRAENGQAPANTDHNIYSVHRHPLNGGDGGDGYRTGQAEAYDICCMGGGGGSGARGGTGGGGYAGKSTHELSFYGVGGGGQAGSSIIQQWMHNPVFTVVEDENRCHYSENPSIILTYDIPSAPAPHVEEEEEGKPKGWCRIFGWCHSKPKENHYSKWSN